MRVKIGEKWYEVSKGQPIMVELEYWDRENFRQMGVASRYACFASAETSTVPEREKWMEAGSLEPPSEYSVLVK